MGLTLQRPPHCTLLLLQSWSKLDLTSGHTPSPSPSCFSHPRPLQVSSGSTSTQIPTLGSASRKYDLRKDVYSKLALLGYQGQILEKTLFSLHLPPGGVLVTDFFLSILFQWA